MTETTQRPRTAAAAAAVVTEFFDRYRAHDVDGMTGLCVINAGFSYVPVELVGQAAGAARRRQGRHGRQAAVDRADRRVP